MALRDPLWADLPWTGTRLGDPLPKSFRPQASRVVALPEVLPEDLLKDLKDFRPEDLLQHFRKDFDLRWAPWDLDRWGPWVMFACLSGATPR